MIANRLLPILIILLAGVVIYFVSSMLNKPQANIPTEHTPSLSEVMGNQPKVPTGVKNDYEEVSAAEQANYLETTKTIAANQKMLEDRMAKFEEEAVQSIITSLEGNVGKKADNILNDLKQQINTYTEHATRTIEEKIKSQPAKQVILDEHGNVITDSDIPAGIGFDQLASGGGWPDGEYEISKGDASGVKEYIRQKKSQTKLITIGAVAGSRFDHNGQRVVFNEKQSAFEPIAEDKKSKKDSKSRANKIKEPQPIPYYTIPEVATLFNNTTLTALLGVVPVKGNVVNPARFKVISGGENIATNGLYLPDVRNIVWSGIAVGNREKQCVSGIVTKVTFTFNDGTIYTQRTSDKKTGLGYISDKWGDPCLPGQFISNVDKYVTNRVAVAGAASLAKATSEANTTKLNDFDSGVVATIIDGDTQEYIAGQTLSGSLKEFSSYLKERQLDAVDIVFLPTGQEVSIHVEEQINIDYNPKGRRLNHESNIASLQGGYID